MKNTIIIFILILSPLIAQAQYDLIRMSDNTLVKGIITKITSTEVEFKKAINPEGPTYTLPQDQVLLITYSNGMTESFSNESPAHPDRPISTNRSAEQGYSYENEIPSRYRGIKEREPIIAGALSFLIPGLGQVYNKQYGKAAIMSGGYILGWVVASSSANNMVYDAYYGTYNSSNGAGVWLGLGTAVGVGIWSIVDAAVTANKINDRYGLVSKISLTPNTQLVMAPGGGLSPTIGAKLSFKLY